MALLGEDLGDGEADAARGPGDDCGAVGHGGDPKLEGADGVDGDRDRAGRRWSGWCSSRAVIRGAAETAERVDVATIAARVEALRGLKFREQPVPVRVSAAQARAEGLSDLDRSYPEARRRADEEVLKLLGLIEPDVDLRAISGSVFGEGVAGYYDPRSKRLRIVEDATPGPLADIVLAHELNHALEDQRFGLAPDPERDATTPRSRGSRSSRARRCSSCRTTCAQYVGADEAMGALLGVGAVGRAGPAQVRPGPADLPVPRRDAVRGGPAPAGRRAAGRSSTRPRSAACPRAPSRSCTRRSGSRASSRSACGWTSDLGSGWRRAARRHLGRVADGAARRRRRGGVGRRPLRAVAARRVRHAAVPQRGRAGRCGGAWDTRGGARTFDANAARGAGRAAVTAPRSVPAATPSRSCWLRRARSRGLSPATLELRQRPRGRSSGVLLTISSSRASTSASIFVFCASVSRLFLTASSSLAVSAVFSAAFSPSTDLFCALATSASDLPARSCSCSCALVSPR